MKVVAIIQARMGSTRLPGKILREVFGKSLLEYQIERVRRAKLIDQIVIATTTKEIDDEIVNVADELTIPYYRGSEDNVLERYYHTAHKYEADVVVRLTSDCPIIDPKVIDKIISCFIEGERYYDYVSNTIERTYPRGMDTEVFTFKALEEAYELGKENIYKEHVTTYIHKNSDRFSILNVKYEKDQSRHRWTVDTSEDLELIERIIKELYTLNPFFSLEDVLNLFEKYPEWYKINSHIEQKK
jgi:spore coat polysaccharide biosynthesis protein SpsF